LILYNKDVILFTLHENCKAALGTFCTDSLQWSLSYMLQIIGKGLHFSCSKWRIYMLLTKRDILCVKVVMFSVSL